MDLMSKAKRATTSTATILSAGLVAACATSPDNIDAQYVSDAQYASYSCAQIGDDLRRIGMRVSEVTEEQDEAATADAVSMGVGLVLFWPALFVLAATDDQEAELSRLKGEHDALQRASNKKGCTSATMAAASATTAPGTQQLPLRSEASQTELAYWQSIERSDNPEFFTSYLTQYPDGPFVPLAKNRLEEMGVPAEDIPPPAPQVVAVSPYVTNQGLLIEEGFLMLTSDPEFEERLKEFFDSVNVRGGFTSQVAEMTEVKKVSLQGLLDDSAVYKVRFRADTAIIGNSKFSTGKFHVEPHGDGYVITQFVDARGMTYRIVTE